MKGKIYQSWVKLAMLCETEIWCLRNNEAAILRITKKATMRAMCGVKLIEKRRSRELMILLDLKDTLDGLARARGVRWYGHILRRDNDNVLKRPLDIDVVEKASERTY